MQQLSKPQRHIEHHILLFDSIRPDCAGVVPAMPGIDHDASNLQAQRAHQ